MTGQAARALADLFGGQATWPMPATRAWGVTLSRPDGEFVAIEDNAGWVYRDRAAYDDYQRTGDSEAVLDAREWSEWGVTEEWATALARLVGGEAYQSGGNIWVVLYARPDGRFVVMGEDGAEIYESRNHYERYYDTNQPDPEFVYFTDSQAAS